MIAALLATLFFSFSAVAATRTARMIGGTEANFWRLALACGVLAAYAYGIGGGLAGDAFPTLFVSGCIGFGLGDVALFEALPRLGSRLTTLLVHCVAAPLAAVTEWLWMGATLSLAEIACGVTILGGVALALAPSEHTHLKRRVFWIGLGFGILSAVGQGMGAVLSRKAFDIARHAGQNLDGVTAAFQRSVGGLIFGGICLLIVKKAWHWDRRGTSALLADEQSGSTSGKSNTVWFWILINAFFGPALGVSCFQWALKTAPTGVVLPIVAVTPLVIVPLSYFMEGEKPSARSLIGSLVAVIAAVVLAVIK